jgi:hypothetical protein
MIGAMKDLTDRHRAAALLLLFTVAPGIAGCRAATQDEASSTIPLDGEGMEPRIITEHPVDAPGRPAGDGTPPPSALEPATASWVPHLEVADLEESSDFYRDLGFSVTGREPDEGPASRLLLTRDGVRLVLVEARPPGDPTGGPGDDEAAAPTDPALVLHLVGPDGDDGRRTVADPDGHRLALPEAG